MKGEMILKEIILYLVLPIVLLVVAVVLIGFGFQRLTEPFYGGKTNGAWNVSV